MIITKKALPRRTFLRGIGTTLALPLLDAMVPALTAVAATPANPIRRLGYVYLPNGVAMNHTGINYWKPGGDGAVLGELSPILSPLSSFRDQMVVISGLSHPQAEAMGDGNGDHPRATATWLSGVHPKYTQGADVQAGTTADQIAAAELGKATPIPSLELGVEVNYMVGNCDNGYSCAYLNTVSWRTPTVPLPAENNPRVIFERLFGDGGTRAQRLAQLRQNRSILDSVTEDMARLQKTLGSGDRARAEEYFDSVREIERRIQKVEGSTTESQPELAVERPPVGIPDNFGDHVKLMFDLQWMAYQGDITRVFTFMMGRETSSRIYPEVGLTVGHHIMSHHGDRPEAIKLYSKLNIYQAELFAYFLEKMRNTPDGDGTLLDHTMLLYGASLSNPNIHSHIDLPLLLAGGTTGQRKGGRKLACPLHTPMTNLLMGMLDDAGVHVDRLGDSTGEIEPLSNL